MPRTVSLRTDTKIVLAFTSEIILFKPWYDNWKRC